jgi:hypothetical protein
MLNKKIKFYLPLWYLLPYFIFSSILIASGQLFHEFKNLNQSEEVRIFSQNRKSNVNLFFSDVLNSLFIFSKDKKNSLQKVNRFSDGFWQILNLKDKNHTLEILTQSKFYIESGKTYTQSIFVRHNGSNLGLQFTFFSANGHFPAKTNINRLSNDLYRISATYVGRPGDIWIRAVDLLVLPDANWDQLSIGFAQLELSDIATPYQWQQNYSFKPEISFFWWVGVFFISFIAMTIGYSSSKLVFFLFLKYSSALILIIYGLMSISQGGNDVFNLKIQFLDLVVTENTNFIAHSSVIISSIILLLEDSAFSILFLLLSLVVSVLFKSYTAIFGNFALLSMCFFRHYSIKIKIVYLAIPMIIFTYIFTSNFYRILDFYSIRSRLEVWLVTTKIWIQNPLFGIGINQFPESYIQFRSLSDLDSTLTHAHNIILQLLAESGIFGCAIYITFLIFIASKIYFKDKNIALTILLTIFTMNMFDFTWFYAWIHIPIWIVIGIAFRIRLQQEASLKIKSINTLVI